MRIIFSLLFVIISGSLVVGQQAGLDRLYEKFNDYRFQSLQEKIYVHHDRTLYLTGETIWFKIYYSDAYHHQPLDLSSVCYVEILDSKNNPVIQTKIDLRNNDRSGSLFIPATINSGSFTLRAYTRWMKNFSPDFFFYSTITIINPFTSPETPAVSENSKIPMIQFFPEGGNLIEGILTKVAFQITDNLGKGVTLTGEILDQNDQKVSSFSTLKFGIGSFQFTPQPGSTYRAQLKDESGAIYTFNLPIAQSAGYALSVLGNKPIQIKIETTLNDASYVYVFIHTRQIIKKIQVQFLQNRVASLLLDDSAFADGISHITVLDQNLHPVAERLYFKRPQQDLDLKVQVDHLTYGTRRKVDLELICKGLSTDILDASIAVHRIDSLAEPIRISLKDFLWLSSDLKGEIESPEYYLTASDSISKIATDNLMLTHGWRRFLWSDVLGRQEQKKFIPETRGHILQASVSDHNGNSIGGVQTYLSALGKLIKFKAATSSADGTTVYEMNDFYGPQKVIIQNSQESSGLNEIHIQNPFSKDYVSRLLPPTDFLSLNQNTLIQKSISMQVQDIYYPSDSNKNRYSGIDSSAFYGIADETYSLDSYTRFPVMEEVMREYVKGVFIRKRKDNFQFILPDRVRNSVLPDHPLVLLDGLLVFDVNKVMILDPLKIKKLEILNRQFHIGSMVTQGIVSFTSYTGDLAGFTLDPALHVTNYEGLQFSRQFYSPIYSDEKSRKNHLPDQRNLLFWSPNVTLHGEAPEKLSFYTSDLPGLYRILLEGLSSQGLPASATFTFEVK